MSSAVKPFRSYEQQVALLESRGMALGDRDQAIAQLQRVNYYRLSGYWYPFRKIHGSGRSDTFYPGTTLEDVVKLYTFDANLRSMTFASLVPIELAVRASLGYALGEIDECAHLNPDVLGARARQGDGYERWLAGYKNEVNASREEFVAHHWDKYGGTLPVWAAVEVLDWGGLTKLYGFSPRGVQDVIADEFGLRAPQLESWLRSLNIVRNICAHHGRLFNQVFAVAPKLPVVGRFPDLDKAGPFTRTFGQLTLIQHLLQARKIGQMRVLPAVFRTFPQVRAVPLSHTGASADWADSSLWSS